MGSYAGMLIFALAFANGVPTKCASHASHAHIGTEYGVIIDVVKRDLRNELALSDAPHQLLSGDSRRSQENCILLSPYATSPRYL